LIVDRVIMDTHNSALDLIKAIDENDYVQVETIIIAGSDLNRKILFNKIHYLPIHLAAAKCDLRIFHLLVRYGANYHEPADHYRLWSQSHRYFFETDLNKQHIVLFNCATIVGTLTWTNEKEYHRIESFFYQILCGKLDSDGYETTIELEIDPILLAYVPLSDRILKRSFDIGLVDKYLQNNYQPSVPELCFRYVLNLEIPESKIENFSYQMFKKLIKSTPTNNFLQKINNKDTNNSTFLDNCFICVSITEISKMLTLEKVIEYTWIIYLVDTGIINRRNVLWSDIVAGRHHNSDKSDVTVISYNRVYRFWGDMTREYLINYFRESTNIDYDDVEKRDLLIITGFLEPDNLSIEKFLKLLPDFYLKIIKIFTTLRTIGCYPLTLLPNELLFHIFSFFLPL
jgi:hypothetical protein